MPSERPIDLALRLAKLRGWNQTEFAAAIGTTSAVISNWKKRGMPAEHHLAVAEVLGLTVDQLLGNAATVHDFEDVSPTGRPAPSPPPQRQITESQWALLEDFEMLPDDEKHALRSTLKTKADNVRRIVAEYLGRKGVTGTAPDARVAESFGAPPPPPPAATETAGAPTGPGSWKKITPVPGGPAAGRKHKEK